MEPNYYNKYIKYKLKYLNLVNQSGSAFTNIIQHDEHSISYKKDLNDHVIELKDIEKIVGEVDNMGTKLYSIYHKTQKACLNNFKLLNKYNKMSGFTASIYTESPLLLHINGTKFELFELFEKFEDTGSKLDINSGILRFTTSEIAKLNFDKFNHFVSGVNPDSSHMVLKKYSNPSYIWNQLKPYASFTYENNNLNLSVVLQHQRLRFSELAFILEKDPTIKIVIPGEIDKTTGRWVHTLGRTINGGQSLALDVYWTQQNKYLYDIMVDEITIMVDQFMDIYSSNTTLGRIGANVNYTEDKEFREKKDQEFKGGPTAKLIHVWGANTGNYNFEDFNKSKIKRKIENFGGGQAAFFNKQEVGIFGIITVNIINNDIQLVLRTQSNYLINYFPNDVAEFYSDLNTLLG